MAAGLQEQEGLTVQTVRVQAHISAARAKALQPANLVKLPGNSMLAVVVEEYPTIPLPASLAVPGAAAWAALTQ